MKEEACAPIDDIVRMKQRKSSHLAPEGSRNLVDYREKEHGFYYLVVIVCMAVQVGNLQ